MAMIVSFAPVGDVDVAGYRKTRVPIRRRPDLGDDLPLLPRGHVRSTSVSRGITASITSLRRELSMIDVPALPRIFTSSIT
jgi:hypothetical protein